MTRDNRSNPNSDIVYLNQDINRTTTLMRREQTMNRAKHRA